jgi:cephalosporin-C deacetylase-like acetyl esterase
MIIAYFSRLTVLILIMMVLPGVPVRAQDMSAALFDYNRAASLDLKVLSTVERDGVTVREIQYTAWERKASSGESALNTAYLVIPRGNGPFPGVLFFHWLGRENADKTQFLDEAVALGKRGAVSLLMQGYFPWKKSPSQAEQDRAFVIRETIEVRRALDILLSQPQVDAKRVAYVGHDYGAMYGSLVAGIEKRVQSYVLIAGMGDFGEWFLKYWLRNISDGDQQLYRKSLSPVDPIHYVAKAAPAELFFQFAENDRFIPRSTADTFFNAASRPKTMKRYDVDHEFILEEATKDRDQWLAGRLGLK